MIRRFVLIILTVLLLAAAGCMTALFIFRQPTPAEFATASIDRPVRLPSDEAAHRDVVTEWWYYTGFLDGNDGHERGFELVFFKSFLPQTMRMGGVPVNAITNPLYFAHLAISDQATGQHSFYTRSNFPKVWQAGAREDRYEVWNGGWQAWGEIPDSGGARHHLRAAAGPYNLALDLETARPAVSHGANAGGVVDMGQAGTSYYYSFTDLQGYGTLTVDGKLEVVEARAWMDHQWGSWTQHGEFAGWDWFSLRLDDGTRAMLFGFRNQDGSKQAESSGTWIGADGAVLHLGQDDFQVAPLEYWTSPTTGRQYPVKWQVTVPGQRLDAIVAATFPEQEMPTGMGPTYWEGTVSVTGAASGDGFVELTGY